MILEGVNKLIKKATGQDKPEVEEQEIDVDYLRKHEVTSRWICDVYNISSQTLKNYRRGLYFRDGKRFYYYKTKDGAVTKLNHIPQVEGGPIRYKVEWMNEWLRLIGQEDFIPEKLEQL